MLQALNRLRRATFYKNSLNAERIIDEDMGIPASKDRFF